MRLLLIRHGESRHTIQKIIATHEACQGLTERGLKQAQDLAHHLKSHFPHASNCVLLSSPARRARETAEHLSQIIPLHPMLIENSLLEMGTGKAEGMTWEQYEEAYSRFDLVSEPQRPFAPDGECWSDFLKRVDTLLTRWSEKYADQTVIAVTHAGFIVAAFLVLFAIPPKGVRAHLDLAFTSLTEWQVTDQVWTLIRFNDVSHLNP